MHIATLRPFFVSFLSTNIGCIICITWITLSIDILRRGLSFGSTPGVLFSSGTTWTEFRRTSLHILKDFGFGKEPFENIIEEEVDNLTNYIDKNFLNQPIDVSRLFNVTVLASLWRVISGDCLKIDDPKLE